MNNPICPKLVLVQDFIIVLFTCKSDDDDKKMKLLSSGQHFSESMFPSRAGYSHANS